MNNVELIKCRFTHVLCAKLQYFKYTCLFLDLKDDTVGYTYLLGFLRHFYMIVDCSSVIFRPSFIWLQSQIFKGKKDTTICITKLPVLEVELLSLRTSVAALLRGAGIEPLNQWLQRYTLDNSIILVVLAVVKEVVN